MRHPTDYGHDNLTLHPRLPKDMHCGGANAIELANLCCLDSIEHLGDDSAERSIGQPDRVSEQDEEAGNAGNASRIGLSRLTDPCSEPSDVGRQDNQGVCVQPGRIPFLNADQILQLNDRIRVYQAIGRTDFVHLALEIHTEGLALTAKWLAALHHYDMARAVREEAQEPVLLMRLHVLVILSGRKDVAMALLDLQPVAGLLQNAMEGGQK